MPTDHTEAIALHRWAVIAPAAPARLTPAERGAVVRAIAAASHDHPDGSTRTYSRHTIDRWLRAYRAEGMEGLRPKPRSDNGALRRLPEMFDEAAALRLEPRSTKRSPRGSTSSSGGSASREQRLLLRSGPGGRRSCDGCGSRSS